ncbi:hypothetical protein Ahy_Scaffold2g107665 [Arachis hypogaea]|uniref:Putative plant transposon protein domain-containing protein n=1 Tax=Arachis hypogaea TaxID=3818 RepID=A0A444WQK0_ARAHY|nr:hypothetical protein Ahy_Scaffold2g107665 [Arachis hypogaea]
MASSSRERREDEFDERRFKSKHNERIFSWMSSKDVVPELPFKLKKDEYPEIQKIIRKRGWELLCDQPQEISMLLIHEFFTNVIREYDDEEPYMSYVRGVDVDFSPDTINRVLRVKHKQFKRTSYEERVENDPRYVDVVKAGVPLREFEETDLVSIGKPLTKERLEFITTTQLERQPLARRKKRKEVRQEEEPQEMDESHTLNMNQLQAALEGISGQYSQIQRSQEEQAQQQRDLWQLMDQQRGVQVQWMNQQNEYQTHMMELQQEQYAKMQEAINNSAMEHEKAIEKVIQEQAQLRIEQAQQRELLHRLDARHETLYRDFNENRMFKEARHKDRLDYDICTQEKLSYLCSTPPLINPQIKCFNEARKIFEQQELARNQGDETRKHGSKKDASWARSWRCQLGIHVANLGLELPTPQHKASLALEATKARSWRCQLRIGVANSTTQGKLGPGGNQGKKLALPT